MIQNLFKILSSSGYRVYDKKSSCRSAEIDRFTIEIPFVHTNLTIRVIFSLNDPSIPPDFIMLVPTIQLRPDYQLLTSDWNYFDPNSFIDILGKIQTEVSNYYLELFYIYKDPIQEMIINSCRALASDSKFFQFYLNHNDYQIKSIHISIPFALKPPDEHSRPIYLNISHEPNNEKFTVDLQLPSWASHINPSNIKSIGVNHFNPSKTEESIRQLFTYFTKELNLILNSKDYRKEFLLHLTKLNLGIPLELDTSDYQKLSFHKEIKPTSTSTSIDILNLVVLLDADFPKSCPSFKLRSMKSIKNNELREKKYMRVKMWDSDNNIKALAQTLASAVETETTEFLNWIKNSI